jgi:hypothetical protein
LKELEKFMVYADNGSMLVGVGQLCLQPVEMGTNGKCVQSNTLEIKLDVVKVSRLASKTDLMSARQRAKQRMIARLETL